MPRVSVIVAIDKKRGIGKTTLGMGKLLWHIPDDLKRFRKLTMGHALIMGRKTFESVLSYTKKPLNGRTSIVITRDRDYKYKGAIVVHSLEEAFSQAKKIESDEIFIIGGGQIFTQALPFAERLYLTLVDSTYDADTFFPDYSAFNKVLSKQDRQTEDGLKFSWLTLEREKAVL